MENTDTCILWHNNHVVRLSQMVRIKGVKRSNKNGCKPKPGHASQSKPKPGHASHTLRKGCGLRDYPLRSASLIAFSMELVHVVLRVLYYPYFQYAACWTECLGLAACETIVLGPARLSTCMCWYGHGWWIVVARLVDAHQLHASWRTDIVLTLRY